MKRLSLEFASRVGPPQWAGWTLLAVSVAFGAHLGWSYTRLRDRIANEETRLAVLRARGLARNFTQVSMQPPGPEELAFARKTIRQLSIPWNGLFAALESTRSSGVGLLSLEPDPNTGTVTITGEAKDYLAMLSYVSNLANQSALENVHLVQHDTDLKDPRLPIDFTISAVWLDRR